MAAETYTVRLVGDFDAIETAFAELEMLIQELPEGPSADLLDFIADWPLDQFVEFCQPDTQTPGVLSCAVVPSLDFKRLLCALMKEVAQGVQTNGP